MTRREYFYNLVIETTARLRRVSIAAPVQALSLFFLFNLPILSV